MSIKAIRPSPGEELFPRGIKIPLKDKRKPRLQDSTDEYRFRIARSLLRVCFLLGGLFILPIFALSLHARAFAVAIAASLAYAVIAVVHLRKTLSSQAVYSALIADLFLVGSFLILRFGNVSTGEAWFCVATMLASVFFGRRGAIFACLAESAILLGLGLAQGTGALSWREDWLKYGMASLDGIGLSVVIGVVQCYLVSGLRSSIEARGRLASELCLRQAELIRESAGRQDAELRADFLERHDPLTRLLNRESFELKLAQAVEIAAGRGRILGVMAVGVDRFKRVGETHGPGAGDAILIEIGNRLAKSFREDDIIARSGGDVFLVLLLDVKNPEDAQEIIAKSRRVFDRSFSVEGAEIGLSASFGLALYPNDGMKSGALIRASEAALQLSKNDGPGSFRLYDAALHSRLIAATSIEHELRGALRAEAFLPWYQPKVDRWGRIIGAEALARWLLPNGGFRQPADFIAAAERSGFIGDLGRIVLAKSCATAAAWERKGLDPIPVSVNLSPYQFRSDDLVRDVRRILAATGLPASRLDLEITESGIMEDEARAIEKLAELKALGCSISIDDFGTGYSSFATLRDYPVDFVKLPQSFVAPLPCDFRASTIAGAVIELAHKLHFSVVAEGVENAQQFDWLGTAECDQYQGFLFAPPMPEEEFEAALARGLSPAVE